MYALQVKTFTVFYMESIVSQRFNYVDICSSYSFVLSTDKMEIIILSLLVSLCKLISRLVLRVV